METKVVKFHIKGTNVFDEKLNVDFVWNHLTQILLQKFFYMQFWFLLANLDLN